MKRFEYMPHTSEVAVRVFGKTMEGLFRNAAYALACVVKEDMPEQRSLSEDVEITAPNGELLLAYFLQEIVGTMDIHDAVFPDVSITELNGTAMKGELRGAGVDQLDEEVKAVTYSDLTITDTEEGYEATVVFDV